MASKISAGFSIDERILKSVEDWIEGSIDAKSLRDQYLAIVKNPRDNLVEAVEKIPDELEALLSDIVVRTPEDRARTTDAIAQAWDV